MVLEGAGLEVLEAPSGEQGLRLVDENEPDLVILDVRLPGMSGLDALQSLRASPHRSALPVLMISGHASLSEAVHAIQQGATDFFEKPLDRDRILVSVNNALKSARLQSEVDSLRAEVNKRYDMIGKSSIMLKLYAAIEKVAPTRGRVLITGESGTGKELIARAIHRLSPRRSNPFVKVNCAALPGSLLESELFGYERGAFTGAQARKKGLFEAADGGTLLLDEIGDMSLEAQAKVLRALQSGEISRVGSERAISVDVRVVAATNKDVEAAVEAGEFREDLYFRLNVVPVRSPALRERKEDIPLLTQAFLSSFCAENGLRAKPIDPAVLQALTSRSWPGNVRELKNVVERMVILSGDRITLADLPDQGRLGQSTHEPRPDAQELARLVAASGQRLTLRKFRENMEKHYILAMLRGLEWNISKAATELGIERTNLHKKMRAYGIRRDTGPPGGPNPGR